LSRGNYARLPRAQRRAEVAQPIFVLGFPRSGTTLLEHILAAHPSIRAGGELRFVKEWRDLVNQLLPGRGPFPSNLQECVVADRRHIATLLRDHYLARAEQMGLLVPDAAFFVDKMPFNEVSLPLIRMAFPEAPIVHAVRHPLDACVSMMSHHFKHGFHCGYRLEDIGHNLAAVHRLQEHYRRELEPGEFILRYETLVANPSPLLERLFAHIGVPFDHAVLRFHESGRYAPTPSYAQVAEPINDRSMGRYRHYGRELEPVRPMIESLNAAWDRLD
jgi:hypothetical protein